MPGGGPLGPATHPTARLGTVLRLPDRRQVAIRITPTVYLPSSFPCPELTPDHLCGIHDITPSRCRTMPFFPSRDETDQAQQLLPRPGWECDTSERAPVVYRDRLIVDQGDFAVERQELLSQAGPLRDYATAAITASPGLLASVAQAAGRGGHVVVGILSFLPRLPEFDALAFATQQRPVLIGFAERTAQRPELQEYHAHYVEWSRTVDRLITRRTTARQSL